MKKQSSSAHGQEKTPLINSEEVVSAASAGVSLINQLSEKFRIAQGDGPLTFRLLGFLGGLSMIVSNFITILDRFLSFNFTGALISLYGILFGIIISLLEAPGQHTGKIKAIIHHYAGFLSFTWGRGAFYFFVGSLQVSNMNMLDWAVGGFMIFLGVTAIAVGMAAARNLRLLKHSLQTDEHLKEAWKEYDSDGNGYLDVKELTQFIQATHVNMTRNEVAATFLALDKNFDEKISYEELYSWWMTAGTSGSSYSFSL